MVFRDVPIGKKVDFQVGLAIEQDKFISTKEGDLLMMPQWISKIFEIMTLLDPESESESPDEMKRYLQPREADGRIQR